MTDFEELGLNEQQRPAQPGTSPRPRAVGSPLPMGTTASSPRSLPQDVPTPPSPAVPLGRALPGAVNSSAQPSGVNRAVNAIRSALPFVQRLLPLLDGNIATTVANILAPQPRPQPPQQAQQPPVDLVHVEDGLAALQTQHQRLSEQITEQNATLRRVEDQLDMVREATDRNTLEQQELMEDLKAFSNRAFAYAVIVSILLLASLFFNLILCFHLQRVLP